MSIFGKSEAQPSRALGLIQVAILSVVSAQPNRAFGSAITDGVSRMIDRELANAQVYVALKRLEERGFVSSRIESGLMPSERKRGRPKVYYALTAQGRRALENAGAYLPSTQPFVRFSHGDRHEGKPQSPNPTPILV